MRNFLLIAENESCEGTNLSVPGAIFVVPRSLHHLPILSSIPRELLRALQASRTLIILNS